MTHGFANILIVFSLISIGCTKTPDEVKESQSYVKAKEQYPPTINPLALAYYLAFVDFEVDLPDPKEQNKMNEILQNEIKDILGVEEWTTLVHFARGAYTMSEEDRQELIADMVAAKQITPEEAEKLVKERLRQKKEEIKDKIKDPFFWISLIPYMKSIKIVKKGTVDVAKHLETIFKTMDPKLVPVIIKTLHPAADPWEVERGGWLLNMASKYHRKLKQQTTIRSPMQKKPRFTLSDKVNGILSNHEINTNLIKLFQTLPLASTKFEDDMFGLLIAASELFGETETNTILERLIPKNMRQEIEKLKKMLEVIKTTFKHDTRREVLFTSTYKNRFESFNQLFLPTLPGTNHPKKKTGFKSYEKLSSDNSYNRIEKQIIQSFIILKACVVQFQLHYKINGVWPTEGVQNFSLPSGKSATSNNNLKFPEKSVLDLAKLWIRRPINWKLANNESKTNFEVFPEPTSDTTTSTSDTTSDPGGYYRFRHSGSKPEKQVNFEWSFYTEEDLEQHGWVHRSGDNQNVSWPCNGHLDFITQP
ncbi:hypothetical protein PN36_35055 [Candidatus Thiomargarita nelsonii]|uniref:Uncharacterized protein n=1 Tax=Candidatus Thiomargarita nelsonii TaxID=1003181 RepID=A0A4E0QWE9_9GAMM|nr:hypothetical protein PN36_35055 [Candidatus Thiomargarita nelsonii]